MEDPKTFHRENSFSQSDDEEFLGFDPSSNCKPRSLWFALKCFLLRVLLHGADKAVKDGRTMKPRNGLALSFEENEYNNGSFSSNYIKKEKVNSLENNKETNFLASIVELMMRFVGFQFSLMISFLTFPIWSSYFFLMFLLFPFQTLNRVKRYFMKRAFKLWGYTYLTVSSSVSKHTKAQKSKALRLSRAFFSSVYVCFVLLGLLVTGFFVGGFMIQRVVEKPVQLRESLNFDYGKSSPVAFVPLNGLNEARVVPQNHKMQVSVSLVVPESEYNQELGVFTVRVDFLSENGKVLASSGHPSMLRFKSRPLRYAETFLSSLPLITGFQSESQIINTKFTDFIEGIEPTMCLKISLEQRAEHQPLGAGIPQVYEASMLLETEQPRLKKLAWLWRRTLFVWSGIVSFLVEFVIALAFLRPLIAPRPILKSVLGKNNRARTKVLKD